MAINDSLVASFYNKYHYNFWRPETAIHEAASDGNPKTEPDPNFVPFVVTPCLPSYPSNHRSASNGAAEVLRRLYGEAGHSITLSNPGVTNIVLHYSSFTQITNDVSDARVWRDPFSNGPRCRICPGASNRQNGFQEQSAAGA